MRRLNQALRIFLPYTGVSIKFEVGSQFEKSKRRYSDSIINAPNEGTLGSICTSKATEQAKSKKRDCDEMFLPLSSDEDDDVNGQSKPTSPAPGF